MKIQVFGSGCNTCKNLYNLTQKVVEDLNIGTEVEYITDIEKMIEMGLIQSPVLVINNKVVMTGATSDPQKIKDLIILSK